MSNKTLKYLILFLSLIFYSEIQGQAPTNPPKPNPAAATKEGGGQNNYYHMYPCYQVEDTRIGTYVTWTAENIAPLSVEITLAITNTLTNEIIQTGSYTFSNKLFNPNLVGVGNTVSYLVDFGEFSSPMGYSYLFQYEVKSNYGGNIGTIVKKHTYQGHFTSNACGEYKNNNPTIQNNPIVYPNPFTTAIPKVKYHINYQTVVKIELYNKFGYHQIILPETLQELGHYEYHLPSTLNSGVYYIKISTWNQTEIITVVKNSLHGIGIW